MGHICAKINTSEVVREGGKAKNHRIGTND